MAFSITLAMARSSSAASAWTRGRVSGTSTDTRLAAVTPAMAAGTTSSSPTSRMTSWSAPVWRRLMSRRLPMRWFRRSAPSSIVSKSSRVASGVKSTSRCNRLLTDALIDESGVRRSCETAARSAVRSSFASANPAARSAPAFNSRCWSAIATWPAKAPSTSRSSSLRLRPRSTRVSEPCSGIEMSAASGSVGGSSPADAAILHPPPPGSGESTATASASNATRTWVTSWGSGSSDPINVPLSAASVSASARACAASTARRDAVATKKLTTAPTTRNATSARTFSTSETAR